MLLLVESENSINGGMEAIKEEQMENAELLHHDPKAVLFDLDGTLIESFASVRDTLISALLYCGYQPPAGECLWRAFWQKRT